MVYPNQQALHKKKLTRYLGLSYIVAGACFLFEPYIGVIDLLPDCLGYLFLFLGLYRFADMDDRLGEALKGARNLALVGIARWIAMLLAFGFVSPTEQPVFMLLALFSLAVLDCIALIPMWKHFCGGLLYMGSRYDATTMFDRRRIGGKLGNYNAVEKYTAVSVVFFILHEALAVLPELTVLSHEKGGAELGQGTHYYDFVGMFRGIGILISLVLGIAWLILTICFIRKLKGDKPFFAKLAEKYRTEILTRHDMWAMRAVRASMICLVIAAVFSLDFYLDGVNLLPDVLAAVMLILSVWFIRAYAGKNPLLLGLIAAFGVVSAIPWVMQIRKYFVWGDTAEIFRHDETFARWQTVMVLQVIGSALFILAFALIPRHLYRMVKRYTGLRAFREDSTYAEERSESIHRLIRKKLIAVMVCAGLVALSTLFHWGVVPYLVDLDIASLVDGSASTANAMETFITTVIQILTDGYWFVDICLGGALVATTVSATGEISEQMEYSYMMKD
jgi:cytochrome c oxidase assembly protein Cox11